MNRLYAAPRPPRKSKPKAPTPHSLSSGKFVAKDALNDPELFAFAAMFHGALQVVLQGLEMVSKSVEPGSEEARLVATIGGGLALIHRAIGDGLTAECLDADGRPLGRKED